MTSQVIEITPQQAHALLARKPNALFVDVRSHMEYLFIGHPVGAIHIPWIDEPDWKINPNFVREIRQLVLGGTSHDGYGSHHNVPVVLICRSGKRSLEAGNLLVKQGFTEVYNIKDGFEGELDEQHHRSSLAGWRYEGLPWEQC